MKYWYVAFLIFIYSTLLAQGEANNWYFGSNAGLSFTSGSPVAITNGQLNTDEGCASIHRVNYCFIRMELLYSIEIIRLC
jgi:hypothetical protein